MRMTRCVVALIILLSICSPGLAYEGTAYMLRYPGGPTTELVKVDLPSEYPSFEEPVVIGQLGLGWVTSMAMAPSGEVMALDSEGDRLLRIDIETGAATPLVDLDFDVRFPESSIAFDDSGQLWLLNTGNESSLHHIDPQTGASTFVVELEDQVELITIKNGIMYGGRGRELVEIDSTTGEVTVLMDRSDPFSYCAIRALHGNQWGLWGISDCRLIGGPGGPPVTCVERYFPLESVADVSSQYDPGQYFSLIVIVQPPAAIPDMTMPGMIVFAFLLAGAGCLIVRSRVSG